MKLCLYDRKMFVSFSLHREYVVSVALSSNKILNWQNIGFRILTDEICHRLLLIRFSYFSSFWQEKVVAADAWQNDAVTRWRDTPHKTPERHERRKQMWWKWNYCRHSGAWKIFMCEHKRRLESQLLYNKTTSLLSFHRFSLLLEKLVSFS